MITARVLTAYYEDNNHAVPLWQFENGVVIAPEIYKDAKFFFENLTSAYKEYGLVVTEDTGDTVETTKYKLAQWWGKHLYSIRNCGMDRFGVEIAGKIKELLSDLPRN